MRDALGSIQSLLILGGTSEIGLATAARMARERLRTVVLAARDVDEARAQVATLREAGAEEVHVVRFEAEETASHAAEIEGIFDRFGDIDAVMVAFGVLGGAGDDQLAHAVDVASTNFVGAVSAMVPSARRLVAQGHGTLIVLSSVAAERARKSNYVYGSSKAGLDAFSQGLHDALAGSAVHVMVVRPGFVMTRMTRHLDPQPLAVHPADVAEAIVRGIRRKATTVWVPPVMRWVMLALRLMPRSLFRRLPI
jgi:decaprenylphospho-beta-D-erythro-pentofuranosid-2-ulose 2-reductase